MKVSLKGLLLLCMMVAVMPATVSWGGPKGPQYVPLEMLSDEKNLAKAVDILTDDTKGKQFGKVKKVVIPTYYIEFRTTSSGVVVKKGLLGQHGVKVKGNVIFSNPDPAVMQAIATAAFADLKERLTAAGYEIVNSGDITALDPYKKVKPFPSGTVSDSLVKQVGFSDFKSMYAAAEGMPIYFDGVGQEPNVLVSPNFDGNALSGAVWEKAGGDVVGVLRPKILVDFVSFIGDTGSTTKQDYNVWGDKIQVTTDYANISAVPQIKIYSSSLTLTRTYVKAIGNTYSDNVGSVYLRTSNELALASTMTGDTLGKVGGADGKWTFTADNEKYKEAAISQLKVFNALMVGKAKTFK